MSIGIGPHIGVGRTQKAAAWVTPANTVAPVASGTPTQGQTLSSTNGTWSNGVSSYAYQWFYNTVNSTVAGTILTGETGSTYVQGSIVAGNYVYCRVSATNPAGSASVFSNIIGPVAASGGLATPTLAIGSTLGAVPVFFNVTDTNYTAGLYGQLQIATDSGFTSIVQNIGKILDGDSWARLDANFGFVDPSGTYFARFRTFRDNDAGTPLTYTDTLGNAVSINADVSAWSNTVTDTISVSVAQWSSTTGTDKSQYLTPSNGNLTMTMNNTVNANCGCRATLSVTGKKYFETTTVSHGNQSNGSLGIGLTDATTALGAAVFPKPGGSGGGGGCCWALKAGSTATVLNVNGAQGAGTSLVTALADGDLIGISFDTTANTVKLSHKAGASAWVDIQTITMTSQIPAAFRAYSCGFGETGAGATPPADAWTTNFGGLAFSRTFDAGYSMYG